MLDAIKPLLESGIINEDTQAAITEAWESQINEARETVRAELREEFARRYDHDKNVMVEALDKMVTESLTAELKEFADEKQALAEDRVKFKRHMVESASKFNNFLVTKLAEEIKELRADRKVQNEATAKLEKFVISALAEEIKEFDQDKRDVVETKVKLVAEAKEKLAELQTAFIKRSAGLVKEAVANNLGTELTQLKEDIQAARENMFGRRLFEAFASEFAVTHLNENKEFQKLQAQLAKKDAIIAESKKAIAEKDFTRGKELVERAKSFNKQFNIMPSDTRPNDLLAQINLMEQAEKNYAAKMAEGEKFATAKDYPRAIASFEAAKIIKPAESLPQTKIDELKRLQNDQASVQEKELIYKDNMAKGNLSQNAKNYAQALSNYENALSAKPNDQVAKDKISEVKQLMDEQANASKSAQEKKARFDALIKISVSCAFAVSAIIMSIAVSEKYSAVDIAMSAIASDFIL
jgi:hypothetical protein